MGFGCMVCWLSVVFVYVVCVGVALCNFEVWSVFVILMLELGNPWAVDSRVCFTCYLGLFCILYFG